MKQALGYSIKVWLTAVFIAPLLFILFTKKAILMSMEIPSKIDIALFMILFGGVLSIPSVLLLFFSCLCLNKLPVNDSKAKLILSFIGIIFTCIPFWLMNNGQFSLGPFMVCSLFAYIISIIAGVWIYRLKPNI